MHALGKIGFRHSLALHLFAQLPGDDARNRFGLSGLADTVFIEEGVEGCAPVRILFAHAYISFMRRRASARSSAGVFCVFLMKPCTTPMRPSCTKNSSRAMRRLGSELRTSHKPSPSGLQSGMPIGQPNCTVA